MLNKKFLVVSLLLMVFVIFSCTSEEPVSVQNEGPTTLSKKSSGEEGDPEILAMMHDINDQLAAQGIGMAVESIELFTIGQGRPSNRIHAQPFRWVPNDSRRLAQGTDITHLFDQSNGATASSLTAAQTETAVDQSFATWQNDKALQKVDLVKVADPGTDPTIFDEFFDPAGTVTGDDDPDAGFPFFADIVTAGWYSRAFVGIVTGAPDNVLAFSVTFIFVDDITGVPTDIDGDNRLDTALNEVYYNDTFGAPGEPREGNPWGINVALPGIDVETVALHENGHSLGIGHFGPPPAAVLNPVYAGIRHSPFPADHAGMAAVWGSWPNP